MPRPRLRIAKREEVSITRRSNVAMIDFHDGSVGTTHLQMGVSVEHMTDEEILEAFNDTVRAMEASAAAYEHVAIEIPPGKPQIRYYVEADQWTPRGDVLRCYISDGGPNGETQIEIDDTCLSLQEFGRLLTTYAGWGMRILFVPDETEPTPPIEVREPDDE
ncbi:MAG: hypothetical protein JWL77_2377 [Chthonomonadaceae bacterium]|nr:hypothetical protein [Chthonomonadaceae bacterium]